MNLIEQVYAALKWKKSDEFSAERLGISLEKYQDIKRQILQTKDLLQQELDNQMIRLVGQRMVDLVDDEEIKNQDLSGLVSQHKEKVVEFKENLDEGTAEIKGVAFSEPKSAEEIIRILKIDESKWKLSSYWNKQHKDCWLVSALVSRKQSEHKDLLINVIENFKPHYEPVKEVFTTDRFSNLTAGVLSIQDLHFGKEGNHSVTEDFKNAVNHLVMRAYMSHKLDEIFYVIGGDLLNMDTFEGSTTKGTPVDNDQRAQEAYTAAFDALYWSVHFLSQFWPKVNVIYLPGNHDRLSSFHMAHALSKCFTGQENIKFDVQYAERKVVTYGSNFFAFEHGDVNSKNTALVYATEFPVQWGETVYRTCYTGHWHRKKTMEYVTEDEVHGFSIKQIPSLSRSDYWHYHNKFTGAKRQAILEIHDVLKGKISEFVYTA